MIQIKLKKINQEYDSIDEENLIYFTRNNAALSKIGFHSAYPIHSHVEYETVDSFPHP
jgi:hypothetical protein